MQLYGVAHERGTGRPCGSFTIKLMLQSNSYMGTIPPKKREVQQGTLKKFCGATALDKATILSLSSYQKSPDQHDNLLHCTLTEAGSMVRRHR
jgi:hypothetical protein